MIPALAAPGNEIGEFLGGFAYRASAPDYGFERFERCGRFDRVHAYSCDETRGRIRWPQ
jgi:hypothetical protein